jgi:hypothetical protein
MSRREQILIWDTGNTMEEMELDILENINEEKENDI